ncbi:helix-turn-helix transcriptional regulator [Sphingomonas sp. XXL09]|uniref:helix-turn-helix transcriptional regulator n=1 Tax=Sphingomonas sp. XXL09 TaxID=3457787 RepID=UPI00406BD85F
MLDLELDLAELLALAPAEDGPAASPVPLTPPDRVVEGLCRAIGALAGCIVAREGDGRHIPIGRIARHQAAREALDILADGERLPARRGYSWIRDDRVPDYCGLAVDMPGAGGHLLLLFACDHLDEQGVTQQVLTLAPGFALAASAVRDMATGLTAIERRHDALAAVLRQSECGIIVVDSDENVLFANPAARIVLDEGDGIELRRNQLRPTRYQDAVRFQAALDAVIAPPRHQEMRAVRGVMLLLERSGKGRPLIAVIAPPGRAGSDDPHACNDNPERDVPGQAAAIIRIMRPESSVARGLEPICHLHGLSPVETQLVACLNRGLTLIEAASQMRIKPDTARTYLKQVFAKTDTHRQSDLLQLMLRYQRAVSGDIAFDAA